MNMFWKKVKIAESYAFFNLSIGKGENENRKKIKVPRNDLKHLRKKFRMKEDLIRLDKRAIYQNIIR